ncbi:MAG: DUF2442 domain-containing protein [Opitutaceae bacterium]|nr:DUF2442 domain-containing protein [Cytophagales bacterium]
MNHEIHYIKRFTIVGPQSIEVVFENNIRKTINLAPVLFGEMYSPLNDAEFFKQVKLDEEVQTLVWPNGADFDPSLLYYWEQHVDELECRAKKWQVLSG